MLFRGSTSAERAADPPRERLPKWGWGGSIESWAVLGCGIELEMVTPQVAVIRVDIPGEASRFLQIRAVGGPGCQLRAVFAEEKW